MQKKTENRDEKWGRNGEKMGKEKKGKGKKEREKEKEKRALRSEGSRGNWGSRRSVKSNPQHSTPPRLRRGGVEWQ